MRWRDGWPLNLGVASKVVLVENEPESASALVLSTNMTSTVTFVKMWLPKQCRVEAGPESAQNRTQQASGCFENRLLQQMLAAQLLEHSGRLQAKSGCWAIQSSSLSN